MSFPNVLIGNLFSINKKLLYLYFDKQKKWDLIHRITSNLSRRIYEHKNKSIDGFTKKYNIDKLVYFEITTDINSAISREKQLKKWNRSWKIDLIEKQNPSWSDLSKDWIPDRVGNDKQTN